MNAPYGAVVSAQDVIDSLQSGRFSAGDQRAIDILSAMFIESAPGLILRCANEVGAAQAALQQLYQQSVQVTGLRCLDWEATQGDLFERKRYYVI